MADCNVENSPKGPILERQTDMVSLALPMSSKTKLTSSCAVLTGTISWSRSLGRPLSFAFDLLLFSPELGGDGYATDA